MTETVGTFSTIRLIGRDNELRKDKGTQKYPLEYAGVDAAEVDCHKRKLPLSNFERYAQMMIDTRK